MDGCLAHLVAVHGIKDDWTVWRGGIRWWWLDRGQFLMCCGRDFCNFTGENRQNPLNYWQNLAAIEGVRGSDTPMALVWLVCGKSMNWPSSDKLS